MEKTKEILIEVDGCIKCENCVAYCPVLKVLGYSAYPGPKHLSAEVTRFPIPEIEVTQDVVFLCSTCARCMVACPMNVPTPLAVEFVRSLASRGEVPEAVTVLKQSLTKNKNIFDRPIEERNAWTDELEKPVKIKNKAETLYFVGCLGSYHPRSIDIALDTIRILNEIEADYTVLGNDEWCCGAPLILAGHPNLAREMAKHNIEAIKKLKVKEVITSCAGCYRTLTQDYPNLVEDGFDFEVLHTSEYLARMIDEGKIAFKKKIISTIAYHDPCELGRRSGVYESPRRVLESIPGIKLVEIKEHGFRANCCGGGGVLKATNPNLSIEIGINRVKEIQDAGVKRVVSCCPACKWNLSDAVTEASVTISVQDLSEIVAEAMGF